MIPSLVLPRPLHRWWTGARQMMTHAFITILAVSIAFSLPVGATYILDKWWPAVAADPGSLLATEVTFAAALVLLFNIVRIAWENGRKGWMSDLASPAHVRLADSRLARWRERRLARRLPVAPDASILTVTGFDTFARGESLLRDALDKAYEIRVLLLNPYARGARVRIDSLPPEITWQDLVREVDASIAYLSSLRTLGKKVTLKFYDHAPFWKIVVRGEHVWVQYCHGGCEIKHEPEYVFALNRREPRQGLYVPFYMHFLEEWNDVGHPEYDFGTRELVYRDAAGTELRRVAFGEASEGEVAARADNECRLLTFRERQPAPGRAFAGRRRAVSA